MLLKHYILCVFVVNIGDRPFKTDIVWSLVSLYTCVGMCVMIFQIIWEAKPRKGFWNDFIHWQCWSLPLCWESELKFSILVSLITGVELQKCPRAESHWVILGLCLLVESHSAAQVDYEGQHFHLTLLYIIYYLYNIYNIYCIYWSDGFWFKAGRVPALLHRKKKVLLNCGTKTVAENAIKAPEMLHWGCDNQDSKVYTYEKLSKRCFIPVR